MKTYFQSYRTDKGEIFIIYNQDGIMRIILPYDSREDINDMECREDENIRRYFDSYFSGEEVPRPGLNASFTEFQKRVFETLQNTKRGTVITYGELAEIIGCSSPRAIGQALKKNPVPIIVPCHRVVGKGWNGGFGGETTGEKMEFKKFLMTIEGIGGCLY